MHIVVIVKLGAPNIKRRYKTTKSYSCMPSYPHVAQKKEFYCLNTFAFALFYPKSTNQYIRFK